MHPNIHTVKHNSVFFYIMYHYITLSSVRKQQKTHPGPVTEGKDGREEAQRDMRRAAMGERRANQDEHPQDFSVSRYVLSYELRLKLNHAY